MDKKIPDRRALEKMTSDLARSMKGKNFKTTKEANKYLEGIMDKSELPERATKDAIQVAQDLMYDAWESDDRNERISLAHKSLSISPDCADAYVLLAEETAKTPEEAKVFYQKGVEAGERALGKKAFKEDVEYFWGIIETRPYMRARLGLAQCLWSLGEYNKAIGHHREMLKLNPGDNQGIRYIFAACLAKLGRYDELEKHLNLKEYKDDCAPDWCYTKALLTFIRKGPSKKANKQLATAIEYNPHVPEYLSGKKTVPKILPGMITMGGEDEAFCYASDLLTTWQKVPDAIEWLKEQARIKPEFPKVGRNYPCPCGSGKKYKKCCGK